MVAIGIALQLWLYTTIRPIFLVLNALALAIAALLMAGIDGVLVVDATSGGVYAHSRRRWPARRSKRLVAAFSQIDSVGVRTRSTPEEFPPYISAEVFLKLKNGSKVALSSFETGELAHFVAGAVASVAGVENEAA